MQCGWSLERAKGERASTGPAVPEPPGCGSVEVQTAASRGADRGEQRQPRAPRTLLANVTFARTVKFRSGSPMTLPAHRIRYSWADYLALEASSKVKHEFLDGQIYGVAGGTPEHAALTAAVSGLLFAQLRNGRYRVHDADLRVRVLETGLATYPDVTVVCGRRERDPEDPNAVTNPTLIVEVLSKSTEEYDRGDKFEHYKRIPTLRQYVLVSYRDRQIEVWSRGNDGWVGSVARQGDRAELDSIGSHLVVAEVYEAAEEPSE